jgi:hypothetical protein
MNTQRVKASSNTFDRQFKARQLQRAVSLIGAGLDTRTASKVTDLIEIALIREAQFDETTSKEIAQLVVHKVERGLAPHIATISIIRAGDAISRRRALQEYGWDGELLGIKFVQLIAGNEIAPAIETVRLAVEAATNLYRELKKVKATGRYHLMYDYSANPLLLVNGAAPTIERSSTPEQMDGIEVTLRRLALAHLSIVRLLSADDAQADQELATMPSVTAMCADSNEPPLCSEMIAPLDYGMISPPV